MTDMEMLEMAAKAAGASDCAGVQSGWEGFIGLRVLWSECGDYEEWNPLTADGDALRLAVDLGLKIEITESTVLVELHKMPSATQLELIGIEPNAATRRAATRRAIVRAAAEIGRAMP